MLISQRDPQFRTGAHHSRPERNAVHAPIQSSIKTPIRDSTSFSHGSKVRGRGHGVSHQVRPTNGCAPSPSQAIPVLRWPLEWRWLRLGLPLWLVDLMVLHVSLAWKTASIHQADQTMKNIPDAMAEKP